MEQPKQQENGWTWRKLMELIDRALGKQYPPPPPPAEPTDLDKPLPPPPVVKGGQR